MKPIPLPNNESDRLKALKQYCVLDTAPEAGFDDLTLIASHICGAPIALVSLVDTERQWFKSKVGLDTTETSRELAFCAHAICQPQHVMVVPDTLCDQRFANSPLVTSEPHIRFYAGTPLVTKEGFALGTLCVIDRVPRQLTPEQVSALQALGRQVIYLLELRKHSAQLEVSISKRQQAEVALRHTNRQLMNTLHKLRRTQAQLIHSEKMSSLGQMVAGIAHEINNPVNFIHANLVHIKSYVKDVLELISLYQKHSPQPQIEIQTKVEDIELDFITADLPKIVASMAVGTDRIQQIVMSLRNFSRLEESARKCVDIHEGINSTLLILQHRLQAADGYPAIEIIKNYGDIPCIDCYAGQLNQVFMNILSNAIDAIHELPVASEIQPSIHNQSSGDYLRSSSCKTFGNTGKVPKIKISTEIYRPGYITIRIADNGGGIPAAIRQNIFDPFFTTKPVGKGTGLGLAISYHIVVKQHGGILKCYSKENKGTEFWVEIPILK